MNKEKIHAIAGITNASLMQDVKDEIAKAVESGMDIEEFKRNFEDTLLRHGWTGESKEEYDLARAWRMELILRQNMQNEYNAGRYEEMMKQSSRYPLWKYQTMEDNRVRPAHRLLDGIIKSYNDDFWTVFYPPNGYNCFPPETLILTESGWKAIAEIKINDKVLGGSGNLQHVKFIHSKLFNGNLVNIILNNSAFSATPNHRLLTSRGWIASKNITLFDNVIEIPEIQFFDNVISDIINRYRNNPENVIIPLDINFPSRSKTFNNKSILDKNINPKSTDIFIKNRFISSLFTIIKDFLFTKCHFSFCVWVSFWMFCIGFNFCIRHFFSYFKPSSRSIYFKFVRYFFKSFAIFFSFTKKRVRKYFSYFRKLLRLTIPSVIIFKPLSFNCIRTIPNWYIEMYQKFFYIPIINFKKFINESKRLFFSQIDINEGFTTGQPIDSFNSIYEFLKYSYFHCKLHKIKNINLVNYNNIVYNLEICNDNSYCLKNTVVHNCRCIVVSLPYNESLVEYSKTDVTFNPIEREFYRNGQIIRPDEGFENNPSDPLQTYLPDYSIYDKKIANEAKKFVESLHNLTW
jgi:SPP1 gp7 family putative phage head morphogenesis protein